MPNLLNKWPEEDTGRAKFTDERGATRRPPTKLRVTKRSYKKELARLPVLRFVTDWSKRLSDLHEIRYRSIL